MAYKSVLYCYNCMVDCETFIK